MYARDTGTDYGVLLSIQDVLTKSGEELGSTKEDLQHIIYARPIDTKNASMINTLLTDIDGNKTIVDQCYEGFYDTVDQTGSGAYSTGDTAVQNKEKIQGIQNNLKDVRDCINTLKEKNISNVISAYNEKLKQLKEGAKRKLLVLAAEEVNEAARKGTSKYVVSSGYEEFPESKYPVDKEVFGADQYVRYSNIKRVQETRSKADGTPEIVYKNTCTATYYVYLKYWGWWPGDFWTLFDWDEEKILKKFRQYGIPIPYSEMSAVE